MTIAESLLPEFDLEMANTRKILAAVPDAALDWTPHPKSMTLGALATHIVNLAHWMRITAESDGLDLATNPPSTPFASRDALLAAFDAGVPAARAALAGCADAQMMAPWTLRAGPRVVFTLPRAAVIRTSVLSHMIHHRGQLSVYLRLQDVALPEIYGPTADSRQG